MLHGIPIYYIWEKDIRETPSKVMNYLKEILHIHNKNTLIIIEHNLDVIKSADYIVDLGPEGGENGGTIVATGTPEEVSKIKESYTGQFLKKMLK